MGLKLVFFDALIVATSYAVRNASFWALFIFVNGVQPNFCAAVIRLLNAAFWAAEMCLFLRLTLMLVPHDGQ